MSVDIPSWGAGEMMVKAKRQLFKMGWKQHESGRIDCIAKEFNGIIVTTIWAGTSLLLNAHKKGFPKDSLESYVRLDDPVIEKATSELRPIFDRIVARNKKRWDSEIKKYEKTHNLAYARNPRYGV